MRTYWLLFFAPLMLFGDYLQLVNDSTFPLRAEIYNSTGDKEASISLGPNQTYTWVRNQSPFVKQYNTPVSPYIVRWYCTNTEPYNYNPPPKDKKEKEANYQSEYGSWANVPPGALVNALGSPNGNKTCVVRKKTKEAPLLNHPPHKPSPGDLGDWDNDGGETWGNDSGPGWETQMPNPEHEAE